MTALRRARPMRAVIRNSLLRFEGLGMLVSIPPRSGDDRDLICLAEAYPGFRIEREPDGTTAPDGLP